MNKSNKTTRQNHKEGQKIPGNEKIQAAPPATGKPATVKQPQPEKSTFKR